MDLFVSVPRLRAISVGLFLLAVAFPASAADLHLIPQPREVKETGGAPFTVTKHTKIVIGSAAGSADSATAQTLADEIEQATGWKLKIEARKSLPGGSDFIYVGVAGKNSKSGDSHLSDELAKHGLALPDGFDSQGYEIFAEKDRVLVAGATAQGAFYGVQTLRQLLRPAESDKSKYECPGVSIRDWPAMKWRGVSIDVSRGSIPTLDYMEKEIRILAGFKVNMYGLYLENEFEVPGDALFSSAHGAISPAEIQQLVAFAQKYYVTVLPELETFGHLHNVLRYDIYSQLAEIPHGAVLTPTQPGTYDFIMKMVEATAKFFPGPFFHIGADETFELGQGQTKQLIAQQGLGQVYLAHIAKLDSALKPYHKQTMFWADIAEHFPDLLSSLPKDLIAVIWTYEPKDSYDGDLDMFDKAGLSIFVSPGVSNWRHVYPDFDRGFINIRNLTRDGQRHKALGQLNTEWQDWGEALRGLNGPGFVFGAACAWQPGESSIQQFRDSYDWAFYRNSDHTFEDVLAKLAATNTLLDNQKMYGTYTSYFWASPFSEEGSYYAQMAAPATHELRVDAEQAWQSLAANRTKAHANADTLDDLLFAAKRLDLLGMKLEYTQEMSEAYWNAFMNMGNHGIVQRNLGVLSSMNGHLQDLREELLSERDEYAARWRTENREEWLADVLIRYDTMAQEIQAKINAITALSDNYSRLQQLPPPESMGFYFRGNQPPNLPQR